MHPIYPETCMFTMTKVRGSKIDLRMHSASQPSTALLLTYCSEKCVCISLSCRQITFIKRAYPMHGLVMVR